MNSSGAFQLPKDLASNQPLILSTFYAVDIIVLKSKNKPNETTEAMKLSIAFRGHCIYTRDARRDAPPYDQ